MINTQFVNHVLDPVYFQSAYAKSPEWRRDMKAAIYKKRSGGCDLTLFGSTAFDMHEALVTRRWVGKQNWQWRIMCEYNVLLLKPEIHRSNPPPREVSYWLLVAMYTKEQIDTWLDSLPFKEPISRPWRGTNGKEVILSIPDMYNVSPLWYRTYRVPNILARLDCEG